jgi:predicted transposase/invertase (TIGR01784 family)
LRKTQFCTVGNKSLQLGEQRGIEKGRNEGKREVARTMLENGIDRNTVMKMIGLTEEDLRRNTH